jgi:hypothetical protein
MRILTNFLLVLLILLSTAYCAADTQTFAVIAAPGTQQTVLSRETVAQIFLHKLNFWPDGSRIHPVNLPAEHPLRTTFSQIILGATPDQFDSYWREMYFHGVVPPHVVASEAAMLLFIQSTPGAIGYVSSCIPARNIEVVLTVGNLPRCPK